MGWLTYRLGYGVQGCVDADDPTSAPQVSVAKWPSSVTSDTFTGTGNGATKQPAVPYKSFTIAVKGTGGVASIWTVVLEGSLDGTNFSTLLTHTNVTGEVPVYSGSSLTPVLYYRSRVSALTLGPASNIVVTVLGVA